MNSEYKTTVITYDKSEQTPVVEQEQKIEQQEKNAVHNVLFNITTKVPHVEETLPTTKVVTSKTQKVDLTPVEKQNKNAKFMPSFYRKELHRSFRLFISWLILTLICIALETWAAIAIAKSNVNNWAMLTLIPALVLCIAFTVVYANNWVNFRNEARNVDFSKQKAVTTNVIKLYKRLKTAHINVNWMCFLTYVAGGLSILITYIIAWAISHKWGVLTPSKFPTQGSAFLVTVIVCSAAMIIAFLFHVVLLVTNYVRAGKIDSFYGVQIVSDEELALLKKHKNKRDAIIFAAVICILILIGFLIYRLIKNRKVQNNVTITNK